MDDTTQSYSFRRSIRLRGYDYSQAGAYFVTICAYNKAYIFGDIGDGEMRLNALGALAYREWLRTADVRNEIELDAFTVMPNHLHGIILILQSENLERSPPLEGVGRRQSPTLESGSLGAIVGQFKSTVTRRARVQNLISNSPLWQRNFYEHVIRNEESLNDIRKYIAFNPARWQEDSLYIG